MLITSKNQLHSNIRLVFDQTEHHSLAKWTRKINHHKKFLPQSPSALWPFRGVKWISLSQNLKEGIWEQHP